MAADDGDPFEQGSSRDSITSRTITLILKTASSISAGKPATSLLSKGWRRFDARVLE
jgi:hypothetical protein